MSRPVDAITNETIRQLLLDMGFSQWDEEPAWAYELAERLADQGWKKK